MQLLIELGDKLRSSGRNNSLQNSMQTQNVSNIQLSKLLHVVVGMHGYKVGRFGKSVNNHPFGIKLVASER
jgi:hypothetical protein